MGQAGLERFDLADAETVGRAAVEPGRFFVESRPGDEQM